MALVCVSGACSRSGKTALAVTLLRALAPGAAAAVKFTTTEDVFERCPRGTPCVVCDIDVPFRIVDQAAVLRQPGTDTDRLAAAGASAVIWAIARRSAVAAAWTAVQRRLGGTSAVIEGSTIVGRVRPELHLFVAHPFLSPERWKPGSEALIGRADAVVINRPQADARPPAPLVLEALQGHAAPGRVRIADVTRRLAEWAPDLAARLSALRCVAASVESHVR